MTKMIFKSVKVNERNAEHFPLKIFYSGDDAEPFIHSPNILGLGSEKMKSFLNTSEKPVFEGIDWRTLQHVIDFIDKGETILEANRAAKFVRFCQEWKVRNIHESMLIRGIHKSFPQLTKEMDLEKIFNYLSTVSHCTFEMEDSIQEPIKNNHETLEDHHYSPCSMRNPKNCFYHQEEAVSTENGEVINIVRSLLTDILENSS